MVVVSFPPATIPLFVYGSLRPGGDLWGAIEPHVVEVAPATVAGRLYWHEGGEWPLLVTEHPGRVLGDLLQLRTGDAVNRVIVDEELLYGYDARWLTVTADDREIEALVLVWPRETELGPVIADGDYATALAARGR